MASSPRNEKNFDSPAQLAVTQFVPYRFGDAPSVNRAFAAVKLLYSRR
jgi:hypothetical protein